MKTKESKIMIIIVLIITLVLIILFNIISLENRTAPIGKGEEKMPLPSCLSKENECSEKEIKKGIKVSVKVNSKTSYVFFVISNDKEKVTLLLDQNLSSAKWSTESNVYGPDLAMKSLSNKTKNWNNIEKINNYDYSDYGFVYLLKESKSFNGGYFLLNITNGVMELQVNSLAIQQEQKITEDYELKARLITYEEIKKLESAGKLPDWLRSGLEKDEGYWTQSSSTEKESTKEKAAYALINQDNKTALKPNEVSKSIGIRPVITIPKEQLQEQ